MLFSSPEARARKLWNRARACGPAAMITYMRQWKCYSHALRCSRPFALEDAIYTFIVLIAEVTRVRYPALMKAPPELFLHYVFAGIEAADTHPEDELELARRRFEEKYPLDKLAFGLMGIAPPIGAGRETRAVVTAANGFDSQALEPQSLRMA